MWSGARSFRPASCVPRSEGAADPNSTIPPTPAATAGPAWPTFVSCAGAATTCAARRPGPKWRWPAPPCTRSSPHRHVRPDQERTSPQRLWPDVPTGPPAPPEQSRPSCWPRTRQTAPRGPRAARTDAIARAPACERLVPHGTDATREARARRRAPGRPRRRPAGRASRSSRTRSCTSPGCRRDRRGRWPDRHRPPWSSASPPDSRAAKVHS